MQASRQANWRAVSLLLANGANANLRSKQRAFALHYAVRRGSTEAAQALLKHGAETGTIDFEEMTPLDWAVENKDAEMVKLLLAHGAKVAKKHAVQLKRYFGKQILQPLPKPRTELHKLL